MNATEIITVPKKESALAVFSEQGGLDPFLRRIREEIDSFVPNTSTKKGRDEIASIAHKVAKSKVALDNVGKELVAELKELPKKVDAERKKMRDTLDAWRDEVRQPLTEWEQKEKERIDVIRAAIDSFAEFAILSGETSDEILERINAVTATEVDESFDEFEAEAHRAKEQSLAALKESYESAVRQEKERAELERLKAEAEERRRQDEREAIAKQAAEEATKAAEQRELAAKKAQEDAEEAARQAALKQKRAEEQAENERLASIERIKQAAENARLAEIRRQAEEKAKIELENEKRAQNKEHKRKINNDALKALIAGGLTDDQAKIAVSLIAKGEIPNVKIVY